MTILNMDATAYFTLLGTCMGLVTLCRQTAARFFAATNTPFIFKTILDCWPLKSSYSIMAVPHSVPFPSGGTWFDTLHKTFDDVHVQAKNDNGIPTSEFLEAAESLTTLFGEPLPSVLLHTHFWNAKFTIRQMC